MTDPISDMLTRIRNASAVRKHELTVPMSKIKLAIAGILKKEGWIQDFGVIKAEGAKNGAGAFDTISVVLKYRKSGRPVITSLRRVSKPGSKVYAKKGELPVVLNNLGIAIISTSQGLMTNKEAKQANLGGEVLCEIY